LSSHWPILSTTDRPKTTKCIRRYRIFNSPAFLTMHMNANWSGLSVNKAFSVTLSVIKIGGGSTERSKIIAETNIDSGTT
ncbi:hypothetical protein PMAYCL1PPCAC_16083, partial [Pristionchus mayeri]